MRIRTLIETISLALATAALFACSGGNSSSSTPPAISAAGKHVVARGYTDWVQQHWVAYKNDNNGSSAIAITTVCSECHGADLGGGISGVSCFTASFQGMECHSNGGEPKLGHASSWVNPASPGFHGSAAYNGVQVKLNSSACYPCHVAGAADLAGFAPSCMSTDAKWGLSCHATAPANAAGATLGCASCHGDSTTGLPSGAAAPNRAGAHAAHIALTAVTCATCHNDAGTLSDKHATAAVANGSVAFVKLDSTYNAQTGGFSYTGTCSAVSCHGGQTTPNWSTGDLDAAQATVSNAYCLSCHQSASQATQYNSFFSGIFNGVNEHESHLLKTFPGSGRLILCSDCHNLDKLAAQHFTGLASPAFAAPGNTVGGLPTSISAYDTTTSNCANSCHTFAPSPVLWKN